jgi:hypothetical protein
MFHVLTLYGTFKNITPFCPTKTPRHAKPTGIVPLFKTHSKNVVFYQPRLHGLK